MMQRQQRNEDPVEIHPAVHLAEQGSNRFNPVCHHDLFRHAVFLRLPVVHPGSASNGCLAEYIRVLIFSSTGTVRLPPPVLYERCDAMAAICDYIVGEFQGPEPWKQLTESNFMQPFAN
jgi:hypothetical protein